MLEKTKVAIVYDWLDKWGGVERVLLTFHEIFPNADFFTSYIDKYKAGWGKDLKIKTSFIQRLPKFIKGNRIVSLPFYPFAFESFDFRDYDLVISVTSSFAKSIITQPKTKHICYLLTPPRFLWTHEKDYIKNNLIKELVGGYLYSLKEWDKIAVQRPDKIISISRTVQDRCFKYYKRKSEVIYPPFDVEYWNKIKLNIKNQISKTHIKNKKYFLIVSRLEPYKKIDLTIAVFNKLNKDLIVVGEGSEEGYLRKISNRNITFLSKLTDQELGDLYSNADALIMPQEEDFGYVSLEAQFFGCPVISYQKGGATETLIDEKTGIFFENQTERSLRQAIARFHKIKYNLRTNTKMFGRENIKKFSKARFISSFVNSI